MYKQCVIVLLCISIAANLTQWKVLCFGADGHIEFESAFHERCDNPAESPVSDKIVFSSQAGHKMCNHCGPCIDAPISNGIAKVSRTIQKLNQQFLSQTTYILRDTAVQGSSLYKSTSNSFSDTSYFSPLRTVILLV